MTKAPGRMPMDMGIRPGMGMARFVFPGASYTRGKEMTLALNSLMKKSAVARTACFASR